MNHSPDHILFVESAGGPGGGRGRDGTLLVTAIRNFLTQYKDEIDQLGNIRMDRAYIEKGMARPVEVLLRKVEAGEDGDFVPLETIRAVSAHVELAAQSVKTGEMSLEEFENVLKLAKASLAEEKRELEAVWPVGPTITLRDFKNEGEKRAKSNPDHGSAPKTRRRGAVDYVLTEDDLPEDHIPVSRKDKSSKPDEKKNLAIESIILIMWKIPFVYISEMSEDGVGIEDFPFKLVMRTIYFVLLAGIVYGCSSATLGWAGDTARQFSAPFGDVNPPIMAPVNNPPSVPSWTIIQGYGSLDENGCLSVSAQDAEAALEAVIAANNGDGKGVGMDVSNPKTVKICSPELLEK